MYEEKPMHKELPQKRSLGEQIFDLLEGCQPEEKRHALREAEERIHASYSKEKEELNEGLKRVEELWNKFKGDPH